MKTTSFFIELIVIGAGAALALVLASLVLTGTCSSSLQLPEIDPASMVLVSLPFVYLLGIVTDRAADTLFEPWSCSLGNQCYPGKREQFWDDRRLLLHLSPAFSVQLEYSRSRMRICRGWAVNGLLLSIAVGLYAGTCDGRHGNAALAALPILLLVTAACALAWKMLTRKEIDRIRLQAEYLKRPQVQELLTGRSVDLS